MAGRYTPIQTNFSAGELTPKLEGRVDLAKLFNGASSLLNYLPMAQGGIRRRPGLRFVAEVKDSTRSTRIIPFEFSATQAYILEVGHLYLRFYRNSARIESGGAAVEIATEYPVGALFNIGYTQSADVLYLAHNDCAPRKVERYSHTCWRFRTITFTPPPTWEYGSRSDVTKAGAIINTTLAAGAVTGDAVTFTAGASVFRQADIGRELLITAGTNSGGRATITGYTSGTQVVAKITSAWQDTATTAAGQWSITGSPHTRMTPSGSTSTKEGTELTLTLAQNGWRDPDDCGKYVYMHGGSLELTAFASPSVATGVIKGEPTSVSAIAECGAWWVEEVAWSCDNGFPDTVSFDSGDRLWWARNNSQPQTAWGSRPGDYESHAFGSLDDDAVVFTISDNKVNAIRALVPHNKGMYLMTAGAEFLMRGGNDSPISPSNVQVTTDTAYGSARGVQPIRIGNVILFLTRSGKKLRELVYNFEGDSYVAPDLLLLAEHLTATDGIVDMAFQREPDPRIWCVRDDGAMLVCTYLRDQNVVAWSRLTTSGNFESVATIPHPDGDREQVWVVVKRTIGGVTKRFVEYFDESSIFVDGNGTRYPSLMTDSALTCEPGSATVFGGWEHLNGETVDILANGAAEAPQAVTSGRITLTAAATQVEAGLPYDSVVTTMRPEVPQPTGSSQPAKVRWARIWIRVLESLGMQAGTSSEAVVPFRSTGDLMGCAPDLQTGDFDVSHIGWDCGKVTIAQRQPLPSTILAVGGVLDQGGA